MARRRKVSRRRRSGGRGPAKKPISFGLVAGAAAGVAALVYFWPNIAEAMSLHTSTSTTQLPGGVSPPPPASTASRATSSRTSGSSTTSGGITNYGTGDAGNKAAAPGAANVNPTQPSDTSGGGFFSGIGNWFANAQQGASFIPGL